MKLEPTGLRVTSQSDFESPTTKSKTSSRPSKRKIRKRRRGTADVGCKFEASAPARI